MSATEITREQIWLDGRLEYKCLDKDNHTVGVIGYYPSGALNFKYPIIDEKFHGCCRCWYESGQLEIEEHYYHGILETRQEWYPTGCLRLKMTKNASIGYYENGNMSFNKSTFGWQYHGKSTEWYEDGTIKSEAYYRNSFLHGTKKEWHRNGVLRSQINFLNGRFDGIYKRWFETGILEATWSNEMGRAHGPHKEWHPNGKIKVESSYRNNVLHGIRRRYNTDGKLIDQEVFIGGVKIKGGLRDTILSGRITAQYITKVNSSFVRRFLVEALGYERLLAQSNHEVIDQRGDEQLVRIQWHKREEDIFLVKVRCPTLGVYYVLRVPPGMRTLHQAVAWTFDLKEDSYLPLLET